MKAFGGILVGAMLALIWQTSIAAGAAEIGRDASASLQKLYASVPAAKAQRCDPFVRVAANEFVKQRHQHTCTACTDGVSEGNRSAIDIHFIHVDAKLAHECD